MSEKNIRQSNAKKNKYFLGYGVAAVLLVMAGISFFSGKKQAPGEEPVEPEIVVAQPETPTLTYSGDYGYYTDDDGAVIAEYKGSETKLTIPADLDGISVYQIGDNVFTDRGDITEVTFPESLRVIGNRAFAGCTGIRELTIPANVTWTGPYAFSGDTGLKKLTIEKGEEDAIIGYFAFSECGALEEVVIPSNYRQIDTRAFANCTALTSFRWESEEGAVSDQDIGGFVFDGCTSLKEIHLEGNVLDIEDAVGYTNYDFTIYAPEGSLAHEIAEENGIKHETEGN